MPAATVVGLTVTLAVVGLVKPTSTAPMVQRVSPRPGGAGHNALIEDLECTISYQIFDDTHAMMIVDAPTVPGVRDNLLAFLIKEGSMVAALSAHFDNAWMRRTPVKTVEEFKKIPGPRRHARWLMIGGDPSSAPNGGSGAARRTRGHLRSVSGAAADTVLAPPTRHRPGLVWLTVLLIEGRRSVLTAPLQQAGQHDSAGIVQHSFAAVTCSKRCALAVLSPLAAEDEERAKVQELFPSSRT